MCQCHVLREESSTLHSVLIEGHFLVQVGFETPFIKLQRHLQALDESSGQGESLGTEQWCFPVVMVSQVQQEGIFTSRNRCNTCLSTTLKVHFYTMSSKNTGKRTQLFCSHPCRCWEARNTWLSESRDGDKGVTRENAQEMSFYLLWWCRMNKYFHDFLNQNVKPPKHGTRWMARTSNLIQMFKSSFVEI